MTNANNRVTANEGGRSSLQDKLAAPMFLLTLVFLAILAGLIVCLVDIPRVAELANSEITDPSIQDTASLETSTRSTRSGPEAASRLLFIAMLLIWPIYWIEFATRQYLRRKSSPSNNQQSGENKLTALLSGLAICILPPLRLGALIQEKDDKLWLPMLGWKTADTDLLERLESFAARPMLMVAFLILPVLLLEYAFSNLVQNHAWLQMTLHVATGFIWWCFTVEFIIMVSSTDRKFQYIKQNWIDLVIIIMPLVSFLRTIRVLRLAKLARIQQVSKVTRVYRMRGLIANVTRGFLLMGLVNKLLRIKPETTLAKLNDKKLDKEEELQDLQEQIDLLQKQIQASNLADKQSLNPGT